MPPIEDSGHLSSDAELITSVRSGDREAFGDLYSRHAAAAAALARQFARSPAEADDLVSEAFARVLDGLLEGKGPDTAFRAYLFTTLRNTAYDRTRKDRRLQFTDDIESHDSAVEVDDPVIADVENGLIGTAFAGLPERWQTVLWHTQVEGQSPADVGILLGMAPNAVSSLAFRAREGLREAYLQAHLAQTAAEQCRTTVDRLGAWTRGGLSKRERAQVDAHLDTCDRCTALAAELSEINTSLRGMLAPLLLGGAAAGYVSTLGPVAPLVQLGTFTGAHAAGSTGSYAATGGKMAGAHAATGSTKVAGGHTALALAKVAAWGPGAALAGAAAFAAAVVAAVFISLSGSGPSTSVANSGLGLPGRLTTSATDSGPGGVVGGGAGAGGGGTRGGSGNAGQGTGSGTNGGGSAPTGGGSGPATGGTPTGSTGPGSTGAGGTGPGGTGTRTGPGGTGSGGTGAVTTPGARPDGENGGPGNGTIPGLNTNPPAPGGGVTATLPLPPGPVDTTTDHTPATPATSGPGVGTSSGVIPTTPGTAGRTATSAPTTTSASTATSLQPTTSATTAAPTTVAPTTPVSTNHTSTTPTTAPTPTPPTTTSPPVPAQLAISASTVSDVVAGGTAAIDVTVTNSGGVTSPSGHSVEFDVPAGVTLAAATPATSFRSAASGTSSRSATAGAVAGLPACSQQLTAITCSLPAIGPFAGLALDVVLDISPLTDDGTIVIRLDGLALASGGIPVKVKPGYATVQLTPTVPGDGLAPDAVNSVALSATTKPGVADAGMLTVGSPDFVVVGVHSSAGVHSNGGAVHQMGVSDSALGCVLAAGSVSCPSAAALGGVVLDVRVAATAGADLSVMAVDQRNRAIAATTSLTVDRSGLDGYRSVRMSGPGHLLRAGSTDTLVLTGALLNPGVTDAGPITVPSRLAEGISIAARPGAALPAGCVAAAQSVVCTPGDGRPARFALPIQVSSDASGTQELADAEIAAGSAPLADTSARVAVDPARSGYDSIALRTGRPLHAGTMGSLTLVAVPGADVTEPGPIRLQQMLARGLMITAADGCVLDGDTYVCPVDQVVNQPTLTVAVLPLATDADGLAPASLDGSRSQPIAQPPTVFPRSPGEVISLRGPFGGTSVAAATMQCSTPGFNVRSECPGGMTTVKSSSAAFTVPAGATVISAELTWAASAPAADPAATLDTVRVGIDGIPSFVAHGVRPADIAGDTTGPDPVATGQMFERVAAATDQAQLAAAATPGAHTVSVTDLAAKSRMAGASPMGAWSLTMLWLDPSLSDSADTGVTTCNRGTFNTSTATGMTTTIAPAGDPVIALYQTIWAPDPWSSKTLSIGGTPVTTNVLGRDGNRVDGLELLHPALPAGGLDGALTFTNTLAGPVGTAPDGLWIGPTLLITHRWKGLTP